MREALAVGLLFVGVGAALWFTAAPRVGPPAPPPPVSPPVSPTTTTGAQTSHGRPGIGPAVVVLGGPRPGQRWNPSSQVGPVHLRLRRDGPASNQAQVWLEEEGLGGLAVDPQGAQSGAAIGRLLGVARFLSGREVSIEREEGLDRALAEGLAAIARRGGAAQVRLVDPAPAGDGLSGDRPGR